MKDFFARVRAGRTATLVVNGVSFEGTSESITDGKVLVDGVPVKTPPARAIHIAVQGGAVSTVSGDIVRA